MLADSVLALDFDLAAAARLLEIERAGLAELDPGLSDATSGAGRTRNIHW